MANKLKGKRAGTAQQKAAPDAMTPYYPGKGGARAAIDKLVGFDTTAMKERGWQWLVDNGRYERDDLGNLQRSSKIHGEPKVARKGQALERAIESVGNLESLYGPERLAGRRWNIALTNIVSALDDFLPFALVRQQEDSFFASQTVGRGLEHVHALNRNVRELVQTLVLKAKEAQRKITTYKDDPLPGLESRKGHLGFLDHMEARLKAAGFTYSEIASLVPDTNRVDDSREHRSQRLQLQHHIERIRKRVSKAKPKVEAETKRSALVEASLATFSKRTGRRIRTGSDAKAWLESPENKALQAQTDTSEGSQDD